jgi:hypothetical protein
MSLKARAETVVKDVISLELFAGGNVGHVTPLQEKSTSQHAD